MTTTTELTKSAGNGEQPPVAIATAAASDGFDKPAIVRVLQAYDIPGMYWGSFERYCQTGVIQGAEFRGRVKTLSQFSDCLRELQTLTRRDFPTADGTSQESFN